MDVRLGDFGGKGRRVSPGELAKILTPVGARRAAAFDWDTVTELLDKLWYMNPVLPSLERTVWLRAFKMPFYNPFVLYIAAQAFPCQWEKAQAWLGAYQLVQGVGYDYKMGKLTTTETELPMWDHHEARWWQERMDNELAGKILLNQLWCDKQIGELMDRRERATAKDERDNHNKWAKEHPWQRRGTTLLLAKLNMLLGDKAAGLPYNQAVCWAWWSGELA
ncbi:MAG: hypothetical protein PHE17_19230 [Thiothrix sp.]|jgi:hypothetical protein|uniref:hypothetical protein n=1 Tax=Thiothrix sp. TaxID=1032 RepID=UPI002610DEF0|nr:hypothetical protein [Thiothrix sp.]MDD5395160.1 hypothetical protein [Thiothrix sp.]